MSDCRFGVSPVNYPDPDPEVWSVGITFYFVKIFYSVGDVRIVKQ